MRDLGWRVFTQTGDIEAYLLYKEMNALGNPDTASEIGADEEGEGTADQPVPS